ncbi:MAG: hypothetical protein K9J30_08040 [Bacteroidales bacterium]|nr:hypothetical protein [Bacteroidales bacterium]
MGILIALTIMILWLGHLVYILTGVSVVWDNPRMHLNTLSDLADAYIESELFADANRVYLKILEAEPEFAWIRDEVYPAFRRKYGF